MKLVVVLVLNLARRGSPLRAIQIKIHQIPQESSKLYEELLTSMAQNDMQDSLRLMRWIHFGLRPLSLRELRTAMAVDACSSSGSVDHYQQTEYYVETDEAMERRVRDLSRGLAGAVQHGEYRVVQFVHQSVIDFLVDEGFDLLDRSQRAATADTFAGRSHFRLSAVCIRYLASVAIPPQEYYPRITNDLDRVFPLLWYSVVYWIPHAKQCERENLSASHLLSYFDSSSLLESWCSMYENLEPWGSWTFCWPITVVHIASRYNLVRALDSILSQSANVDLKNRRGHTPLSIAAEKGYEKVVKLLLERTDVEADSKDSDNRSPLSWAAEYGSEAVVKLLLERNDIEADSKDKNNRSPLSLAATSGHRAVVELLLERDDVIVDSVDIWGQTCLHSASQWGYEGTVRVLIEQGNANVDSKDLDGRTPMWYANKYEHEGIVRLLEQHLSQEESESYRGNKRRRL